MELRFTRLSFHLSEPLTQSIKLCGDTASYYLFMRRMREFQRPYESHSRRSELKKGLRTVQLSQVKQNVRTGLYNLAPTAQFRIHRTWGIGVPSNRPASANGDFAGMNSEVPSQIAEFSYSQQTTFIDEVHPVELQIF